MPKRSVRKRMERESQERRKQALLSHYDRIINTLNELKQDYLERREEMPDMDLRYLDHTQRCPKCGGNALLTDGKFTFCSVINCRWTKPYATITKGAKDDSDNGSVSTDRPSKTGDSSSD